MPHLVYSAEEIESCLHFIQLQDDGGKSLWWPCLVFENMSMLHGVCQQRGYRQDPGDASERLLAYQAQCLVDGPGGAWTRRVVLLLGQVPPGASRYLFHSDENRWTIRSMMGDSLHECFFPLDADFAFLQAFGEANSFTVPQANSNNFSAPNNNANGPSAAVGAIAAADEDDGFFNVGGRKVAVVEP